jgi:hypothetical protein
MTEQTTFPFLKIAREHGVPYGAVIRIAEAMPMLARGRGAFLDDQTGADFDFYRHPVLINDIAAAIVAERERREEMPWCNHCQCYHHVKARCIDK